MAEVTVWKGQVYTTLERVGAGVEGHERDALRHRFRIIARNGEILATGEAYENEADAIATCRALMGSRGPIEKLDDSGAVIAIL